MNILVTGGTGFIGSHLTERLVNKGHNVVCLVRPSSNVQWIGHLPLHFRYDLAELERFDLIYHNAGVHPPASREEFYDVHVHMTERILDGMSLSTTLIYTSSAYAGEPTEYGTSKLQGEKVLDNRCRIVKPGTVYGPRDMQVLRLFKWIKRLGPFFPIQGNGQNLVCPVYIDDVIDVLVSNKSATIAGKPISMEGLICRMADAVGVPKPRFHSPALIKRDFFTKQRVFDSTLSKMPLSEGLQKTVEWYRHNGFL